METFLSIINGIIIFCIGAAIIKYRMPIKRWTGPFMFVERYLGRGSTYFIIILVGGGLMVLGFFWPFGGLDFIFQIEEGVQNTTIEK